MKKVFYVVLFFISFIWFFPKDNLFFSVQDILSKNQIYLPSVKVEDKGYKLNIKDVKIYYNKMDIGSIENIDFFSFLVYNKFYLSNIKLNFQDLFIKKLNINYFIVSPFKISIVGDANFGKIDGFFDLKDKKGKIYILDIKNDDIKSLLNKDKKGYFYAFSF